MSNLETEREKKENATMKARINECEVKKRGMRKSFNWKDCD